MAFTELVFSGVQPTGNLHLGNYLGAIVKFVALQQRLRMHLLRRRPARHHGVAGPGRAQAQHPRGRRGLHRLRHRSRSSTIVFNQSQVAEHAELAWVFNCVARLGWLNRMTQFKEKAGKDRENASIGLYAYPALMAADILVYRATHVPVGEDQKQHLELSRDIAQKFNNDFAASIAAGGSATLLPAARAADPGAGDARDVAARRHQEDVEVRSVGLFAHQPRPTMPTPSPRRSARPRPIRSRCPSEEKGLEARPEADNLVGIYAALADASKAAVLAQFGGGAVLDLQGGAGRPRGRQARPDRRGDEAAGRRHRLYRFRAGRRGSACPGDGGEDHAAGQGHRRVHPARA